MCGKKAAGVDQMTKDDYEENLDGNIESLVHIIAVRAEKDNFELKGKPARRNTVLA